MPERDLERARRFSAAIGRAASDSLVEAIGDATRKSDGKLTAVFFTIGEIAAKQSVSPEDLLIGVRETARPVFDANTGDSTAFDDAWHTNVRALMKGYFNRAPSSRD